MGSHQMGHSLPLLSEGDIDIYMEELSNWGRWGDDDDRGTLNLISQVSRKAALSTVRTGETVSCARPLDLRRPSDPPAPQHFMTATGDRAPAGGMGMAVDWVGFAFHGSHVTHLDAHSHIFWKGKLYNGRPAQDVSVWQRARSGGVDAASEGIVTRGVLLDIPRHRSVPRLAPGEAVGVDEMQECAAVQGVVIGEGDAVLVRTGRDVEPLDESPGMAGLHASTLPWIREYGISLLGCDNISDAQPSRVGGVRLPIHSVGLVGLGLWLLDNAYLETLAQKCEERGAWDFLFNCLPLRFERATGSPVNPIAML
jgi:kynurenine formamidase